MNPSINNQGEPSANKSLKIVIIGSGIAGLSAAYYLKNDHGFDVTVLEAQHIPGGRMADHMVGNFRNFTGATGILPISKDLLSLIDRVGLRKSLISFPEYGVGTAYNGIIPYTIDMTPKPWRMLMHPAVGFASKMKLPMLLPDLIRARLGTNPNLMFTADFLDEQNLVDYLRDKVGVDFLENIVAPIFRALWTWDPEDVSCGYFLALAAHMAKTNGYTFDTGIGTLTRHLSQQLDVRLNTRVTSVGVSADGQRRVVEYTTETGKACLEADIVVCAIEGNKVKAILKNQTSAEKTFFADVPYAQYAMAMFILNGDLPLKGVYNTRAVRSPLAFYKFYPRQNGPNGAPARIWAELAPDRAAHYLRPSGDNLIDIMRHEVQKIFPALEERIADIIPQYNGYTIAKFPAGQLRKMSQFIRAQEAGPKNIYYIGDYLSNATTGGACAIALRTAKVIAGHWKTRAR
jgi:oxygen-dependent protoporphyrinogen oxidase